MPRAIITCQLSIKQNNMRSTRIIIAAVLAVACIPFSYARWNFDITVERYPSEPGVDCWGIAAEDPVVVRNAKCYDFSEPVAAFGYGWAAHRHYRKCVAQLSQRSTRRPATDYLIVCR